MTPPGSAHLRSGALTHASLPDRTGAPRVAGPHTWRENVSHECKHCGQPLPQPDEMRLYYMADCHGFYRLKGTVREAAAQAKEIAKDEPYGMLCPPILLRGEKEIRRVGDGPLSPQAAVHAGPRDKWDEFCAAVDRWVDLILADPDVARLDAAASR